MVSMSTTVAITGLALLIASYAIEDPGSQMMAMRIGHYMLIAGYFALLTAKVKKAKDGETSEGAMKTGHSLVLAFVVMAYLMHSSAHPVHYYDLLAFVGHGIMIAYLSDVRINGQPVNPKHGAIALMLYYAISARHHAHEQQTQQAVARAVLALAYGADVFSH